MLRKVDASCWSCDVFGSGTESHNEKVRWRKTCARWILDPQVFARISAQNLKRQSRGISMIPCPYIVYIVWPFFILQIYKNPTTIFDSSIVKIYKIVLFQGRSWTSTLSLQLPYCLTFGQPWAAQNRPPPIRTGGCQTPSAIPSANGNFVHRICLVSSHGVYQKSWNLHTSPRSCKTCYPVCPFGVPLVFL